ncbi:MAG: Eco57I restriction-modification methylase domain-containing protein [Methanoregula sp.]|nr:MAG: Eco57I restriction-modification methylase domain-containing protein [Methanoregula sp.]
MAVPGAVRDLVQRYADNRFVYHKGQKNETELRREFLDPFFRALGWDVDNNKGYSEAYKEVAHEDPIRIRGQTKFIDYSFRVGGMRKFICEAKKPSVPIKDDLDSALQLRRYAWNAGLKLSILTNFEEFAVYDCNVPIRKEDNAATARIAFLTFENYPERWDRIASVFSPEAILKGSYDKYVATNGEKHGTAGVDEKFLEDIEDWRLKLARNIALRNPLLTVEQLNTAVQLIIDRIIFLRICEDRGIEKYETLRTLTDGEGVYGRLCELFRTADDKYNSGLFYFTGEPGRDELPDTLTPGLVIDDNVLARIINHLYYPESPYEFSVIPAEMLGHVYEQFLGKVIRLTASHRADVDDKPEVRKAGGVFYTPSYIVDYIVEKTVGELLKRKTPRDVAMLRICDPACGSGSFLLGAYQYLLDWHRDWYIEKLVPVLIDHPATSPEVRALLPEPPGSKKAAKKEGGFELPVYKTTNGDGSKLRSGWKLTTAERKRILLNNIYGVDIDTQAVEVTKLSLLLKVLEEESEENVAKQLKLTAERALPSLHHNVRCGNSLVAPDFFDYRQAHPFNMEERKRVNAFDWKAGFPQVMAAGGFDAVIGNPPYVRQESLKEQKEYFQSRYAVYQGTADLYAYFIEKGISLLREGGIFSYIVANKWMRANYGKPLRKFLLTKQIEEVVDFGDLPVFKDATTYPCILRVSNAQPSREFCVSKVDTLDFPDLAEYVKAHRHPIDQKSLTDGSWTLGDKRTENLLKKLQSVGRPLEDYVMGAVYRGIVTGFNDAFVIDEKTRNRLIEEDPKSAEIIKPFIVGKDVKRYKAPRNEGKFLIFTRHGIEIKQYPAILNYLKRFKANLMPKPIDWNGEQWKGRKPGLYEWYEIQDTIDYFTEFEKVKIVYPEICQKPEFTLDEARYYTNNKCFIIPRSDKYLLGVLNSKLTYFLFETNLPKLRAGFFMPAYVVLKNFPIYTPDFDKLADKTRHDRMVDLVTQMLSLHAYLQKAKTDQEKRLVQQEIDTMDVKIDALVYELYGLTADEIGVIEASSA